MVTGVPQGSVLGPTLFLIFMNDLTSLQLHGRIFLYADNTTLFYPAESCSENIRLINQDLNTLEDYRNNLLILNRSKTKYVHFHNKRQVLDPHSSIIAGNEIVERVTKITFLGLTLNENVDW